MRKPKFVPTFRNLKRIASLLKTCLIIADTHILNPRVFEYWQRYCKAEWDGRYNVKCLAASNTTAIISYAGTRLYVTVDQVSNGIGFYYTTNVEPYLTK